MKKIVTLFLAFALCLTMLAGCGLSHEWEEADCENPKTCAKCDKVEGEALGHEWEDADCVNPKTCSRCDETKGEALGHEWVAADCVNPETCSRCGETTGEALGHSNSFWKPVNDSTMNRTCATCGNSEEAPMDRELIGRQHLVGKWELHSIYISNTWMDYAPGWFLEINEDGTFTLTTTEVNSGDLVYVEFYDGDSMDFYVFDGIAASSSYSINYEPVEDVVYIIGGKYFEFVRVTE